MRKIQPSIEKSTVKKIAMPLIPSSVWPTEKESTRESCRVARRVGSELERRVRESKCVCLTSEQFNVIYTGYGYLLFFLLFLFLFTPQHRQLVEFQGNDIVVICQLRMRKCDYIFRKPDNTSMTSDYM